MLASGIVGQQSVQQWDQFALPRRKRTTVRTLNPFHHSVSLLPGQALPTYGYSTPSREGGATPLVLPMGVPPKEDLKSDLFGGKVVKAFTPFSKKAGGRF
jgi:hypothetical protein